MEKINRKALKDIPSLEKLHNNWQKWGEELQEYQAYVKAKKEGKDTTQMKQGQTFSWREGIRPDLLQELEDQIDEHCSFCDGYPLGTESLEPIEHYYPKADFPCLAYTWGNLFYICDKCNSEANKTTFEFTLKPDQVDYQFDTYFYFDASTGRLEVLENLEIEQPDLYQKATKFLERYGINTPKRTKARELHLINDVQNFLQNTSNPTDQRERKHFKYRYVFDFVKKLIE